MHQPGRAAMPGCAVIGTGTIFEAYVRGIRADGAVRLLRVADRTADRARDAAERVSIPRWGDVADVAKDADIEIVVNITPPAEHAAVTEYCLQAGKHVYVEKPMASALKPAQACIAQAERRGLALGCAPDTFLGFTNQLARKIVDQGVIGEVFAATSFVRSSGALGWHPDPTFLYQAGGGPVLDFGPYHVTSLVNLLGPVSSVMADPTIPRSKLPVTSPGRRVDSVEVNIPTHVSGSLRMHSGAVVTAMYSFEVAETDLPHIEIYGTEGTLRLPEPRRYDRDAFLRLTGEKEWHSAAAQMGLAPPNPERKSPGLGVQDLALHLVGGEHRARGELGLHVLEVLEAMQDTHTAGVTQTIRSSITRPAPVEAADDMAEVRRR